MQGTGSASATLARSRYRSLPQLSRRGVEGRLHALARFRSLHPCEERVDLTAITATDARSATVTTADGRRFRTDDSGRTWRQI